jgi:hypothetical protein
MNKQITYLDHLPAGWFVLDVMRAKGRTRDWVALAIDADPDDYRAYRIHTVRQAWVRIPGKYRNRDAACDALEAMIASSPAVSEAVQ